MRLANNALPSLTLGSLDGTGTSHKPSSDGEDDLWRDQQAKLSQLRAELGRVSTPDYITRHGDADARRIFNLLAGKLHVGNWESLLPTFSSIQALGKNFHQGFVVLGGWHHQGTVDRMAHAPKELLGLVRNYRGCLRIGESCHWVLNGPAETKQKSEDLLAERLAIYRGLPAIKLWRRPNELLHQVASEKSNLETEIETALLFLKQRVFLFSPTAKNAVAGWDDFNLFVVAYQELVDKFSSNFGNYFWGIYLPKK